MEVPDALLGRRVALRHRLSDGRLTDAVGELAAETGEALVVHTRIRCQLADGVRQQAAGQPVTQRDTASQQSVRHLHSDHPSCRTAAA